MDRYLRSCRNNYQYSLLSDNVINLLCGIAGVRDLPFDNQGSIGCCGNGGGYSSVFLPVHIYLQLNTLLYAVFFFYLRQTGFPLNPIYFLYPLQN
jgi:hypothetical protein